MFKIIFMLLFFIAFTNYAFSQLYVNGRNINDSANLKIIELDAVDNLIHGGGWDKQRWYRINYGQPAGHENSQLTDNLGKRLQLKNIIELANYFVNNGWSLFQVNYYIYNSIPNYKYTFVRK